MSTKLVVPQSPVDNSVPHVLYRAFDQGGLLLYIGISLSPVQRFRTHERESSWWTDVAVLRLEHFPTRAAALAAEQAAIHAEHPAHNVIHNRVAAIRPTASELVLHVRLRSQDLRARLDAYCQREQVSLTAAVNILLDKALFDDAARRSHKNLERTP